MVPEYTNEMTQMMEELSASLTGSLLSSGFSNLLSIAIYVFTALALYTIANRRGIAAAWLAWIPVAQLWILGSISDNYQQAAFGKKKVKRHLLIWLQVIVAVLAIAMVIMLIVSIISLWGNGVLEGGGYDSLEQLPDPFALLTGLAPVFGILLVMGIVAIFSAVLQYMAFYDIYRSCDPDNATLYLVLSIFFSFAQPIFLMICRNKDNGMPRYNIPAEPQWSENL